MKIAFVHSVCTYYTQKTLELFAGYYDVNYYFHSTGDEWYWQKEHGIQTGDFQHEYLWGFKIGRTRITPALIFKLWRGKYNIYICSIAGRFALPMTYLIARLKRKPFILWTGVWHRIKTPFHFFIFPLTRYLYIHADAIVVYGEHVKRYLMNEGVPTGKIFVASHAVDNEFYGRQVPKLDTQRLRDQLQIEPNYKVILYLGRLEEGKGLPYLLDAFASLRRDDAILVVAGTGTLRSGLEKIASAKGISHKLRFPGFINLDETVDYYAISWVYVLPSVSTPVFKEPWGLVVNEAFNQGVPVVATEAVGAAAGGLVQDGVNGLIVPEKDCQALAQAMDRILNDPDLRGQMSFKSKEIIARWTQENMVLGFRRAVDYLTGHE